MATNTTTHTAPTTSTIISTWTTGNINTIIITDYDHAPLQRHQLTYPEAPPPHLHFRFKTTEIIPKVAPNIRNWLYRYFLHVSRPTASTFWGCRCTIEESELDPAHRYMHRMQRIVEDAHQANSGWNWPPHKRGFWAKHEFPAENAVCQPSRWAWPDFYQAVGLAIKHRNCLEKRRLEKTKRQLAQAQKKRIELTGAGKEYNSDSDASNLIDIEKRISVLGAKVERMQEYVDGNQNVINDWCKGTKLECTETYVDKNLAWEMLDWDGKPW